MRRIYGPKNESLNEAQRQLFGILDQGEVCELTAQSRSGAGGASSGSKKKGGGRKPKPENLPVVRQVIDLPEEQKAALVCIREEITKQLEYRPSQLYMLHLVQPVYASPTRAHATILAPLPPQVIPHAGVGTGFITHVVVAKYCDALPLYRHESIDARAGALVPRQARCRYVDGAAHLLITIREQLKQKILDSRYVQIDESFTKLLDPERRGRSHDAYLWGYLAPHEKALVIAFSPSRSGSILYDFFPAQWQGEVQTDGAKMYPGVFKHRPNITPYECIGHLRRYVLDAIKADELEALPLLRDITALYQIERKAMKQAIRWVLPQLAAATNKTAHGLLPHDFARLHPSEAYVTPHEQ